MIVEKEKLNVFTATETIGMSVVNSSSFSEPAPTQITFGGTSLQELAAKQQKREKDLPSGACCFTCEYRDKLSQRCKLKISDAVLTVMRAEHECCGSWEPEKDHGITLRVVAPDEEKKKAASEHLMKEQAIERGFQQGLISEQLDTVFDIACQQVPACSERWMQLKADLHLLLARKWVEEETMK